MTLFDYAAVAVTGLAALWDIRTGRIPNPLTLGALAGGLVGHAVAGGMVSGASGLAQGFLDALVGALVCAAVPTIVFFLRGIGGGDVKLFAALGALCLVRHGLEAETFSFVAALLIAPAYLAYHGKLLGTVGNTLALVVNPLRPREKRHVVPNEMMTWFRLGPAIFAGTCVMLYLAR